MPTKTTHTKDEMDVVNALLSMGAMKEMKQKVKKARPATGRWTNEEHLLFLQGLEMHGKDCKKISKMIKTRSEIQIRSHAQKYFGKVEQFKQLHGVQAGPDTDRHLLMDGRRVATVLPQVKRPPSIPSKPGTASASGGGGNPNMATALVPPPQVARPATGRWTSEEHLLFLQGLELHGKDFKKISKMIKTRSEIQIKSHAQKYFGKVEQFKQLHGVQAGPDTDRHLLMDGRRVATALPQVKRPPSIPSKPGTASASGGGGGGGLGRRSFACKECKLKHKLCRCESEPTNYAAALTYSTGGLLKKARR
jgi:SHAQKYF class myb-like DNA-binding protein